MLTAAMKKVVGPIDDPAWRRVLLKVLWLSLVPVVALAIPGAISAGDQVSVPGVLGGSALIYVIIVVGAVQVSRTIWRNRR